MLRDKQSSGKPVLSLSKRPGSCDGSWMKITVPQPNFNGRFPLSLSPREREFSSLPRVCAKTARRASVWLRPPCGGEADAHRAAGKGLFVMNYGNITKRQLVIRLSFAVICFIAAEMLLLSQHAAAAEWLITPSLNLKETYSDNIRLAPRGSERSEWITGIDPGISFSGKGSNLKVNASYQMQNSFYAKDSQEHSRNHQLNADANAKLVDELLFLDGKASISQQNISLFGPQAADNTNITGNRASVATYSISPYLRHRFDDIASSELRYTHDEVRTRVGGLSNSEGDSTLFNLNSGTAFSRLGWGLHYNKHKTGYSNQPAVDTETYSGDLRFPITPKFSLTAIKGYEKNNYLSISGEPPEGRFWTAGFSWTPTARTSLVASTGRRYFGKTHSLAASHRSRNTAWSLNYSEDITSSRNQFLSPTTDTATYLNLLCLTAIDPVSCRQDVANAIESGAIPATLPYAINYFTNQYFLQKRLQASVALSGAKSTVLFTLFNTIRKSQTSSVMDSILLGTGSLTLDNTTKQLGGSALWNWRISPRTSAHISAAYTRNRSSSQTDYDKSIRLGITRQIQPRLSGSVEFRRLMHDSSLSSSAYIENAATASLLMKF